MGRHSKGKRTLLGCRATERLDLAVRAEAVRRHMTISDYIATVLAQELRLPEEVPPQDHQGQELPLTG